MNIGNIRLSNQQLLGSKFETPQQLVAWMGAMQAQDYPMVKWAIGNRLPNITDKMVEDAIAEGKILRTHVLRPTWHLVAAQDIRWMLALTGERLKNTISGYAKHLGLDPKIFLQTDQIIRRSLEGNRHKTREELSELVRQAGVQNDSHQITQMMAHAELGGIVCSGSPRGKKQTYTLIDEWIPRTAELSKDESLSKLARSYFLSHAPATLQDFVWWSGLNTSDARRGLEMIKVDLESFDSENQTYWINRDVDQSKLNQDSFLLLPAFDEYLVSYKDRSAVLASENLRKIITSNGIFRPAIVHNGHIIGTWKKQTSKTNIRVEPTFFSKPSEQTSILFEEASAELGVYYDLKI